MKALFIGGTGTISTEISALCVKRGWELTLINRGNGGERVPEGARVVKLDISDEAKAAEFMANESFDVVADFIVFTPEQLKRDIRLFSGKTKQYFFISSASAYQKPLSSPWITEGTPLCNPYWQYSRDKIACEELLMKEYRENGFPITIIRPSHTYCERSVPVALHGRNGSFSVLERIRAGKKVIIPGDGTTLWTLTHSRDFAVAFCGLMMNPHAKGEVFQITGDESLTWNQVYEQVGLALGVAPKPVHIASESLAWLREGFSGELIGDKSNTVLFDNTKIKRAVPEFATTIRFNEGARMAVEHIYSHPECRQPDPEFDAWCDVVIERYENAFGAMPKLDY